MSCSWRTIWEKKMYVTRTLSQLRKSPELLSSPPDGPNSGFLLIQDKESETYSFFGLFKNRAIKDLPFPQNKELDVGYGDPPESAFLIPVLNQPLSSNLYYAIDPHGKHKGEAFTCSKEEDKTACCFYLTVQDVKQRPLDPRNVYQQFQIARHSKSGHFLSKSVAPDGYPPHFLRTKGWPIYTRVSKVNVIHVKLQEAQGVNSALRSRLPELNLSHAVSSSELVLVGKWYCPFIFVKEKTLRYQVKHSLYYVMTLEQRWEQVFSFQKNNVSDCRGNSVKIDALVDKEQVFIYGNQAACTFNNAVNGVIWFTGYESGGGQVSMGLREEVVHRMKWEQERFGWFGGNERQVKISHIEIFDESWSELKCYVLVERFNLKRNDGSLVMAYDFKHPHRMRIKWD